MKHIVIKDLFKLSINNEGITMKHNTYEHEKEFEVVLKAPLQSTNLYATLIEQLEPKLFRAVLSKNRYNQVKTAKALGISRGCLRYKLSHYFGDEFVGTRN